MTLKIGTVAILGSGTMGRQLAAHFSNVGIPVLLFDVKQELSANAIEAAASQRPSPFYDKKSAQLIKPCNYDEYLKLIRDVDWVLESSSEMKSGTTAPRSFSFAIISGSQCRAWP